MTIALAAFQCVTWILVLFDSFQVVGREVQAVVKDIFHFGLYIGKDLLHLFPGIGFIADGLGGSLFDLAGDFHLVFVRAELLLAVITPIFVLVGRPLLGVKDQQPGPHRIFGRHTRFILERRYISHRRRKKPVLLLCKRRVRRV